MKKIIDIDCWCTKCRWVGSVDMCIPAIDDDGNLGCPFCKSIIERETKQHMDIEEFKSQIEEVDRLYAQEYAKETRWEIIDDDPEGFFTAELWLKTWDDQEWIIPIIESPDGKDEAVIDIGDAGYLDLTGEGIYLFLWHEAMRWIAELKREMPDKFCPHCGQNWTKQGGCPCI